MDKNGKSRRLPKDLCRKVFAAEFPHYIFDGNTIGFSMVPVGAETKVHQRRDEDIMITIKPTARTITTGQTSLSEVARDASQMLEILVYIYLFMSLEAILNCPDSPISISHYDRSRQKSVL